MKYHINMRFGGESHALWNYEKNELIEDFVVPFINGQVVPVKRHGEHVLFNMKSVISLSIYKTTYNLTRQSGDHAPKEFDDPLFASHECTTEIISEIKGSKASEPFRSLLEKAFTPPEKKVFVIMRFYDDDLDSAYELAIKPVVHEEYGFKCRRIDEIHDSGSINQEILEEIATSKYILADLTGERPNCYYEVGFAHALGKEIILTIRDKESPHFDVSMYRFIKWKTPVDLRDQLRKRFTALSNYRND